MKAEELRIRNLIMASDTPDIIEVFQLDRDSDNRARINYMGDHNFKPIELTEEWLMKFGFVKPAYSFIYEKFHITKQDNSDYWFTAFNINNAFIKKLRYVHELQNLQFIIDNKELTIK